MKRLVIRIAALGTVVVLGLIAIAQAQRGMRGDDSTDTSAATESSGNPLRNSTAAPARTSEVSLAPSESVNPLRSQPAETDRYGSPEPRRLVLDDNRATVVRASDAPPVESTPMRSPFATQVGGQEPIGTETARPLNPPPRSAGFPDASTAGLPAMGSAVSTSDSGRYAEPPRTLDRFPEDAQSRPISAGRYSATEPSRENLVRENPIRENVITRDSDPGRLGADSLTPPAGVLPLRESNIDSRAERGLPGMTAAATDSVPLDSPSSRPLSSRPLSSGPSLGSSALAMNGPRMDSLSESTPAAISGDEGSGQPGGKQLEGPQSPRVSIQKIAPAEIQVGKPATFKVAVVNTGEMPAAGVEIRDQVPKGTRLVGTTPRAKRGTRGELVWSLGTIAPGDETTVEMQVMPVAEGEIGSVATVHFTASASARTVSTRPQLVVKTSAPGRVLIGEDVKLSITISNPGSGTASGVVLSERIPAGLRHVSGSDLEYEVGDLKPGATKKLELTLTAARAGKIVNVLTARGEGNLRAEDRTTFEILAPALDIAVKGSKRRYLEREATYELSVANPGTAAAEGVELVAYLPTGLKFVSANNAGYYEEADRSIRWRLQELPTGETGTVQMVAMPIEEGQHKLRLKGTAKKGLAVEKEQPLSVEGITAIMFEAVDVQDPIEVGGETTYEIRVLNQGSKAATNVQVAVTLPHQMQAVAAEGPTRHVVDRNRIVFDGLSRLAPKADITYRVRVKGLQPGDLRASVKVKTNEMQTPVTKEESTRVYAED